RRFVSHPLRSRRADRVLPGGASRRDRHGNSRRTIFSMAAVPAARVSQVVINKVRPPEGGHYSNLVALAALLVAISTGLTAEARRIVSIIPSTTEMLFAMGAGDRVAAVGSYDRFPAAVEKLPR